jgi:hypothetical protein
MNERIIIEIYQCLRDLGSDIEYDETVKLIETLKNVQNERGEGK